MTDKNYKSAISILRELPAVFELRDVEAKLGVSTDYASQYCWRWKSEKLIKQFASGVYFNLVANPNSPSTMVREAIHRVIRTPVVLIGSSGLHANGWTTQRAAQTQIAVPVTREIRSIKKMAGVVAEGRYPAWFQTVLPLSKPDVDGILLPPPEYVLVDMIAARAKYRALDDAAKARLRGRTIWYADPDDVDIGTDEPEDAVKRIYAAGKALGVPEEELTEYMSGMDDLSGYLDGAGTPRP